ncbi:hypothetical protein RKD28_003613 [Streptomyces sp. SAI-229]
MPFALCRRRLPLRRPRHRSADGVERGRGGDGSAENRRSGSLSAPAGRRDRHHRDIRISAFHKWIIDSASFLFPHPSLVNLSSDKDDPSKSNLRQAVRSVFFGLCFPGETVNRFPISTISSHDRHSTGKLRHPCALADLSPTCPRTPSRRPGRQGPQARLPPHPDRHGPPRPHPPTAQEDPDRRRRHHRPRRRPPAQGRRPRRHDPRGQHRPCRRTHQDLPRHRAPPALRRPRPVRRGGRHATARLPSARPRPRRQTRTRPPPVLQRGRGPLHRQRSRRPRPPGHLHVLHRPDLDLRRRQPRLPRTRQTRQLLDPRQPGPGAAGRLHHRSRTDQRGIPPHRRRGPRPRGEDGRRRAGERTRLLLPHRRRKARRQTVRRMGRGLGPGDPRLRRLLDGRLPARPRRAQRRGDRGRRDAGEHVLPAAPLLLPQLPEPQRHQPRRPLLGDPRRQLAPAARPCTRACSKR